MDIRIIIIFIPIYPGSRVPEAPGPRVLSLLPRPCFSGSRICVQIEDATS